MFAVSRFKNRNGVFSFRVDGQLNGVRIRRNFKSQEEAAAEKSVLELKALQLASSLSAVTTCLAEDQVREAEAVFRRLAGGSRTLSFCVDYALTNHRTPENQKALDDKLIDPAYLDSPIIYPDEAASKNLFNVVDVGDDAARLYNDAWTELKTLLGQ